MTEQTEYFCPQFDPSNPLVAKMFAEWRARGASEDPILIAVRRGDAYGLFWLSPKALRCFSRFANLFTTLTEKALTHPNYRRTN